MVARVLCAGGCADTGTEARELLQEAGMWGRLAAELAVEGCFFYVGQQRRGCEEG